MALPDLPVEELVRYRPPVPEPDDFDDFWQRTLSEARAHDLDVHSKQVDTPYRTITVYDVRFSGYAGDRISAWLTTPRGLDGPLPAVVEFVGYGGGRDLPGTSLAWACAGYAHLLIAFARAYRPWFARQPHGADLRRVGWLRPLGPRRSLRTPKWNEGPPLARSRPSTVASSHA